jgi:hypothetical protein
MKRYLSLFSVLRFFWVSGALGAILALGCDADRRGRGGDAGTPDADVSTSDSEVAKGDAGDDERDGAVPTDGGVIDADASLDVDTGPTGPDGGTVDHTTLRVTVPFRLHGFDIDREGDFVAVGRGTIGGTHTAYFCSGPSRRSGTLDEGVPTAAIVRRNRATSETFVAYQLSGAAGLRVWFLRAFSSSCDLAGTAPTHMFDAEWADGSFHAESVLAMDVSDAGGAWVVSEYRGEHRLTRFESGIRREQLDIGSCSWGTPPVAFALALAPRTGAGVIACSGATGTTTAGIFVRRFDNRGLVDTSWVPVPDTAGGFDIHVLDVAMIDAGDIGVSRVDTLLDSGSFRYERHLTTLTPAAGARGSAALGAHGGAFMQIDGFVRDRGAPTSFVLALRPEGTLSRFGPDAASLGTSASSALVSASPVLVDRHGRTYVQDGTDIVRNAISLP